MLGSARALVLWLVLLCASGVLHAFISGHVGQDIEPSAPPIPEQEIQVVMEEIAPPKFEEREPPPEEQLDFEEEFELDPPDMLIAPKAVVPPPPDVTMALKAQSGGFQGLDIPTGVGAVPLSAGQGIGGFKSGIGNGLGDGSARFAAYVAGLREAGLDVVFAIDATGSMGWVIDEVKNRIQDISQIVRSLVPIARFGIVAFRDEQDPEFVTRIQPLTYSNSKLQRFLVSLEAKGGGDWFEAVDAGMIRAIDEAGWRPGARRIIIVVSDAPVREKDIGELARIAEQFRRFGGTVSTLDVSDQANPALVEASVGRAVNRALYRGEPMAAFRIIAEAGSGDAATLEGDIKLTKRLIRLIMGDQFARQMKALLDVF
ncbi:MAG: vWA domain-containing protein [Pseudomonadota bacterium]